MTRPEWLPEGWDYWEQRSLAVLRPDCDGGHGRRVVSSLSAGIRNEHGGFGRRINWCDDAGCEAKARAEIEGGNP